MGDPTEDWVLSLVLNRSSGYRHSYFGSHGRRSRGHIGVFSEQGETWGLARTSHVPRLKRLQECISRRRADHSIPLSFLEKWNDSSYNIKI
ncbi:unnamed protein product [Haemonchus placei]|uniref:Uncharacterized protein n=1 Tax=Haemonchus placei TaxID=6290 RepID=A0A0N4WSA3_HAEPC|nr:unnamed protein product [Haemonchus placei]